MAPPSVDLYSISNDVPPWEPTRTHTRCLDCPSESCTVRLAIDSVTGGGADLLYRPGGAAIGRTGHGERDRQRVTVAIAAETRPADYTLPKNGLLWALSAHICDLSEKIVDLLGDHHRVHPRRPVTSGRRAGVVGAGHGDGPRSPGRRCWSGSSRSGWSSTAGNRWPRKRFRWWRDGARKRPRVAVGDQAVLEVVGQGADRPDRAAAGGGGRDSSARSTPCRSAASMTCPVKGEIHPRDADPGREGTRRRVTGVARLHVNVVVGSGTTTDGVCASTATAGSFCLFCEKGFSGCPRSPGCRWWADLRQAWPWRSRPLPVPGMMRRRPQQTSVFASALPCRIGPCGSRRPCRGCGPPRFGPPEAGPRLERAPGARGVKPLTGETPAVPGLLHPLASRQQPVVQRRAAQPHKLSLFPASQPGSYPGCSSRFRFCCPHNTHDRRAAAPIDPGSRPRGHLGSGRRDGRVRAFTMLWWRWPRTLPWPWCRGCAALTR